MNWMQYIISTFQCLLKLRIFLSLKSYGIIHEMKNIVLNLGTFLWFYR